MITAEIIINTPKSDLEGLSQVLTANDIALLIDWLSDKDDKLRYPCFLILLHKAKASDGLYKYWDLFLEKLKSSNSYQIDIGLALIAANVRWDRDRKFEKCFESFCALLYCEKPIAVRQCIQSFADIVPYKPELAGKIADRLMSIDIPSARDTMQKLFLLDIINILLLIRKTLRTDEIDKYISDALIGGILDNKSKKAISALL